MPVAGLEGRAGLRPLPCFSMDVMPRLPRGRCYVATLDARSHHGHTRAVGHSRVDRSIALILPTSTVLRSARRLPRSNDMTASHLEARLDDELCTQTTNARDARL